MLTSKVIVEKFVIHRLPYMVMNEKTSSTVNLCLVLVTCILAHQYEFMHSIMHVVTTFTYPFSIFIFPGMFYFYANDKLARQMHFNVDMKNSFL
jgi:hypothetical protein